MRIRIFIALALAAVAANAQTLQVRQYAAKFVCGKASDTQTGTFNFAPGSYFTSINVHNPALTTAIEFRKKFAFAERNEGPGKVSEWFAAALKPDQAMQVDCGSIYKHLGIAPGTFIDGFAVIQISNTSRSWTSTTSTPWPAAAAYRASTPSAWRDGSRSSQL